MRLQQSAPPQQQAPPVPVQATKPITHNRRLRSPRRLLFGLLAAATGLTLVEGIVFIRDWRISHGELPETLYSGTLNHGVPFPDGKILLGLYGYNGVAKIEMKTGQVTWLPTDRQAFSTPPSSWNVALTPNGERALLTGLPGYIRDVQSGKALWKSPENLSTTRFSADGSRAWWVSEAASQKITVWDTQKNQEIAKIPLRIPEGTLLRGFDPIDDQLLSPHGTWLAQAQVLEQPGHTQRAVALWRVGEKRPRGFMRCEVAGEVTLAFSSDESRLLVLSGATDQNQAGSLTCVDVASGQPLWTGGQPGSFHKATFSPDGRFVAAATATHRLVYDARTSQLLWSARLPEAGHLLQSLSFSEDGKALLEVLKIRETLTVRRWNIPRR